jgi:hypothetical protein
MCQHGDGTGAGFSPGWRRSGSSRAASEKGTTEMNILKNTKCATGEDVEAHGYRKPEDETLTDQDAGDVEAHLARYRPGQQRGLHHP